MYKNANKSTDIKPKLELASRHDCPSEYLRRMYDEWDNIVIRRRLIYNKNLPLDLMERMVYDDYPWFSVYHANANKKLIEVCDLLEYLIFDYVSEA